MFRTLWSVEQTEINKNAGKFELEFEVVTSRTNSLWNEFIDQLPDLESPGRTPGRLEIRLAASIALDVTERKATQGDVIYNDDTIMKILKAIAENNTAKSSRTGIFTTNILSILEGRKIALFFTGR
jgi:hypothetical protein